MVRGRDAYGSKHIVRGLLKHGGKVYIEMVPNCKSETLQGIIRGGELCLNTSFTLMDGVVAVFWLIFAMINILIRLGS